MISFAILIDVGNNIAELCNGSTPVSGTVCQGSNPCSAANKTPYPGVFFLCPETGHNRQQKTRDHKSDTNAGFCLVICYYSESGIRSSAPGGIHYRILPVS